MVRDSEETKSETSLPDGLEIILGSSFYHDKHSKEYSANILSKICHYSQESTILILDNLDIIYGALYDLFNQRFANSQDNRYCNVIYEDFKKTLLISPKFKCIILKDDIDLTIKAHLIENALPSPLMNRFEKHLISMEMINSQSKLVIWFN